MGVHRRSLGRGGEGWGGSGWWGWWGFTLTELLAVVVVLSLAAAVSIGSIGGLSQTHQRRSAIASVRDGVERVRLLAERFGGAALSSEAGLAGKGGDIEVRVGLPRGWDVKLLDDGGRPLEAGRIVFDHAGRSMDFAIELAGPSGASARLRVLGLSGQVIEQEGNQR